MLKIPSTYFAIGKYIQFDVVVRQKEKIGSKGPHQMGAPDLPEHTRQVRTLERQGAEKKTEKRKRSMEENVAAAEKAARKDIERFLADGDDDLELERSGAEN